MDTFDKAGVCKDCVDGGICDFEGMTMATLGVKPGYWRGSTTTDEIYECIRWKNCKGGTMWKNTTARPTTGPTTSPTASPTTASPTTSRPPMAAAATAGPTALPTLAPSALPAPAPSVASTARPSLEPTTSPLPSPCPSALPSPAPSHLPSPGPSTSPSSASPSALPSPAPSHLPSQEADTHHPSAAQSPSPSSSPPPSDGGATTAPTPPPEIDAAPVGDALCTGHAKGVGCNTCTANHYRIASGVDAGKCVSCNDADYKSIAIAVIGLSLVVAIFAGGCVKVATMYEGAAW